MRVELLSNLTHREVQALKAKLPEWMISHYATGPFNKRPYILVYRPESWSPASSVHLVAA